VPIGCCVTESEGFHQAAAADRGNGEGAAIAHPFDPFQFEAPARQSRADGAPDVRPPFGPIHARAAKDAAPGARR
jgi:hypothetical protein